MPELQFQLVFQFGAKGIVDFDDLLALTEQVEAHLSNETETVVDGHDFGLGEFNIFIHTNQPVPIFETTADFIDSQRPGIAFSAGYRAFESDEYNPLWPSDSTSFVVA